MIRQRIVWFSIILLIFTSLACNAFTGVREPDLGLPPPPTPNGEITPAPAEQTGQIDGLAPTATLINETAATAAVNGAGAASATVLIDLNVRRGPAIQYDRVSFMLKGESATIIGRDPATGWWKIECPPRIEANECWISGGDRYATVAHTEGVPIAEIPPTPTPPPTPATAESNVVAGEGLLVYASSSGLWAVTPDLAADPAKVGEPVQLSDSLNIDRIFIAPDGLKAAYTTQTAEKEVLYLVNIDGSGGKILVNSTFIPIADSGGTADVKVRLGQIQWLSDSQAIAFNSTLQNIVGPGSRSQEDLWTVSLNGSLTERFSAGNGGGAFDVSADNQLIMSQSDRIIRASLDGSEWQTIIDFEKVNTASEWIYYPKPQWTSDGRLALVAIASPEQFDESAEARLWRIPRSGPAEFTRALAGNILFNPVIWSDNGISLAYVQQIIDSANIPPALTLADGDGANPTSYATDNPLRFDGWSPAGDSFIYSGAGFYAVGRSGAAAVTTILDGDVGAVQWLTPSRFIIAIESGSGWQMSISDLAGNLTLLATARSDTAQMDVWTP